jgi:tripartite-type tricarboxylate transporter receptor subunit TctC
LKYRAIAFLCFLLCFSASSIGQQWPSKPVRIVVPWPPAGAIDILARGLSDRLSKRWAQPVVVENKVGAASIIGAELVAKSPPDGYVLMLTSDATITGNFFLFKKLPYDPVKDFTPITQLVEVPQLLIISASTGIGTVKQLVDQSKRMVLNYASWGSGTAPHLFFETLKAQSGASIQHVPYKGPADVVRAIGAGEIQMSLASAATWYGLISSGKARAIAITHSQRLPNMPDVATLTEQGYGDTDPNSWLGLLGPAAIPRNVAQKIHSDIESIFSEAEFREKQLQARGLVPVVSNAEGFTAFIARDLKLKERLIRTSGATAE